tara:strand:+ start:287 stop:532 length:246 start_codon:yes stop_codon:yes gene_type:complete
MTIENLKLAVRAMGSVINDLTNELDALQKKYDDLKKDERRYYEWWHDETKEHDKLKEEHDKLKVILEKMHFGEPVEADESN